MLRMKSKYLSTVAAIGLSVLAASPLNAQNFDRVASFPVFENTDIDDDTVAEIITAVQGGRTLVYTDSEREGVGFINIQRPNRPLADGFIELEGEPTSVVGVGPLVLVAVNTSEDFINVSGQLVVIDLRGRSIVKTFELGGQPDSIDVSPDGRYAAIAIENERDEDLGDGFPPQAPAGDLFVVNTNGQFPDAWKTARVPLTGLGVDFEDDPEPEFIDINAANFAVVSLQENNALVVVDLEAAIADPAGAVLTAFSAGDVAALENVDVEENELIELTDTLANIKREPDAVAWVKDEFIATANEGDLVGGSRGFSILNIFGEVLFDSGNALEHLVASIGHYPEDRSENKGNEPESILFAEYGEDQLLFVGSERSSVVAVYDVSDMPDEASAFVAGDEPELLQVLPTGVGPEGLLAIPRRNLLVVANEVDDRGDKIRSTVGIYQRRRAGAEAAARARDGAYPLIRSETDPSTGAPTPWGALSALAFDDETGTLFSVHDSFYRRTKVFAIDPSTSPASLTVSFELEDVGGLLAAEDPALVEADGAVNLDAEGVALSADGGFWIASEGAGTVGSASRPFEFANYLVKTDGEGAITRVVALPDDVEALQVRFGFEGVASVLENGVEILFVAFQREWAGDPANRVRIGRYDTGSGAWTFAYYPIEVPTSPNGGWVGLSEIVALGDGRFAVIERDNQAGPDARIKRITEFSTDGVTFLPNAESPDFDIVAKKTVRDLIAQGDLTRPGGLILEKIEGLAVNGEGGAWWVNDNDGVDDSNGETQLRMIDRVLR